MTAANDAIHDRMSLTPTPSGNPQGPVDVLRLRSVDALERLEPLALDEARLDRHGRLFSSLPENTRTHLLCAAILNDSRLERLGGITTKVANVARLTEPDATFPRTTARIATALGVQNILDQILATSPRGDTPFFDTLVHIRRNTLRALSGDRLRAAIVESMALAATGWCPLLNYAFERWIPPGSPPTKTEAALQQELSYAYLYRLVSIDVNTDSSENEILLGEGAYSSVYLREDPIEGRLVSKRPRNLAAREWVHELEARIAQEASSTELSHFVPRYISFDRRSAVIQRSYIAGMSGHDLLKADFFETNSASIEELRALYEAAESFMKETGVLLDLHPGNILLSERGARWVLVDLGPVPHIGSDYYARGDFLRYFQEVWLERLERMKSQPIRSVDLSCLPTL